MTILGLDPGLARTGFGVIQVTREPRYVRCGCLETPPSLSLADRLHILGDDLSQLIQAARPDLAVVEQVFFGKNVKTAFLTAQARGVLIYVLRKHHIPVETLTPLQIKSRLTGYGSANKSQIQAMVSKRLNLSALPQPDDAADALAAALAYNQSESQIKI